MDPFFGREDILRDLKDGVEAGERLLTIAGPAGTGKTRLSLHFGATQLAAFPGGVWLIDLSEARTRAGVVGATAATLGVPLTQSDGAKQLADAIMGRGRALYLLDNFEQVVEAANDTLGRWLDRAPDAVFLVTSRRPLQLGPERLYPLAPMGTEDAMALFYDRGERALRGFGRTEENAGLVREIVERLDCVALAVELAAARIRILPPARLLPRLAARRFDLLSSARRDAPGRQATLRGAIDWSWDLLDPGEQSVLAQLAVFRGGCNLEAAEAVIDLSSLPDAPWTMDIIQSLVDHSLLQVHTHAAHTRYRLLESIREYALEKLGDATADTRARHAAYFATLGQPPAILALETHDGAEGRATLAREHENIRAALAYTTTARNPERAAECAMAAAHHLHWAGPLPDALEFLAQVPSETLPPAVQARLMTLRCSILATVNDRNAVLSLCEDALEIARVAADRRLVGRLLRLRATARLGVGDAPGGKADLDDALRISAAVGALTGEASVREWLGHYHKDRGEMPAAQRRLTESLALLQRAGNRAREASAMSNLGSFYGDVGDQNQALALTQEALTIHQEVGNRRSQAVAHTNLGLYNRDLGHLDQALSHYDEAVRIARSVGVRTIEAISLGNKGDLLTDMGETDNAGGLYRAAVGICDDIGHAVIGGTFRGSLAVILAQRGDLAGARQLIAIGAAALRDVHTLEYAKLLCKEAKVEAQGGDVGRAHAAILSVEALISELGLLPGSEVHRGLGQAKAALETGAPPSL